MTTSATDNTNTSRTSRQRVLAIDVDYTLIRPVYTAVEVFAAALLDREPAPAPTAPGEKRIDVVLPHSKRRVANYCRPGVTAAIDQLPGELEILWLTSWLIGKKQLRALQHQLGIRQDRIQLPTIPIDPTTGEPAGPARDALVGGDLRLMDHWKTQTVIHLLDSNPEVELLWIDDEVGQRLWNLISREHRDRLHYLTPQEEPAFMLTESDIAMIQQWTTGDLPLLRFDRSARRPWWG